MGHDRREDLWLTAPQSPHVLVEEFHKAKKDSLTRREMGIPAEQTKPQPSTVPMGDRMFYWVLEQNQADPPSERADQPGLQGHLPGTAPLKVAPLPFDSLHYLLGCILPFPSGIISHHRIVADAWWTAVQMESISHAAIWEQLNQISQYTPSNILNGTMKWEVYGSKSTYDTSTLVANCCFMQRVCNTSCHVVWTAPSVSSTQVVRSVSF